MPDLIAAIATALLPSGVGIIRLSGDGAADAAEKIFRPQSGKPLSYYPDRSLIFGEVYDEQGEMIDRGLAFLSHAPHSYTGEETAELHCHGSPMVLTLVLEALFAVGARQALPGEFTKRAFLNGKLDLAQAEAVIDLIDAETPAAARYAAGQLEGTLSRLVEEIYGGLVNTLAHFYAVLDYPDEDIDPFREETIREALQAGLDRIEELLSTYHRGRQITYGVPCAIIGRPNVGKSSLLNAMAGYQRAIVTEIAGTTRDTIEERVTLGGVLLRLIDTAGLRETEDLVEQMGVARSRAAAEEAELSFLVLDGSMPLNGEDWEAIALAKKSANTICVINKADLEPAFEVSALQGDFSSVCRVSAATGTGLQELEKVVAELFPFGRKTGSAPFLTNARQYAAAERAKDCLVRARDGLFEGLPPDLVLTDVEGALASLGELTGRTIRDDITDRIFQRFCVGK
ncbi:MAG: tRNA uridine-5-carboxymethylaminomethyl(34) synthesis GTPase MnmE [Evtepia sp.]|nr:tRNA uridine-5-carboxymethylaminomethyl(34) synthesis GTPase MnmE [Evtepia sp.]